MHINSLCRICLVKIPKEKSYPLFEEENQECVGIVKKIEECGGIKIKLLAEFPKYICMDCVDSLNVSYKFRSLCQASESALLNIVVKYEISPESNHIAEDTEKNFLNKTDELAFSDLLNTNELDFDISDLKTDREHFLEEFEYHNTNVDDTAETSSETGTEDELSKALLNAKEKKEEYKPLTSKRKKLKGKRGRPPIRDLQILENQANKTSKRGRKKVEDTEARIICEICGNIYTKRSLLNMHMRRHTAEKPFECEICGKTFACGSAQARHIRVHTGEKPYICRYCGRTFADRSTNIKHERIHTNERPFQCKTCGKSFTYSNVLKNHMLTHTGEKPFTCVPCNKTFSRKHQLEQHISTLTHQQTIKVGVSNLSNEFSQETGQAAINLETILSECS